MSSIPSNGEYTASTNDKPANREQLRLALALWELAPSFTDRQFEEKCLLNEIGAERLQELLQERMIEIGSGTGTRRDLFGTLTSYTLTSKGRTFVKEHLPDSVRAKVQRREMFRSTGIAMFLPVAIGIRGLPFALQHTLGRLGDLPCHVAAVAALVALSAVGVNWQFGLDPWTRKRR